MFVLKGLVLLALISGGACDNDGDNDKGISTNAIYGMIAGVVVLLLICACVCIRYPQAVEYVSVIHFGKSAAADGTYKFPIIPPQGGQQKGAQGAV